MGAAAGAAPRKEVYNRKVFPPTWHLVSRASKFQKMNLIVAVKQQNLAELDKKFWAVSDPKSPDWQKFMSAEEIGAIVKSKETDMAAVMDWIKASVSKDAKVTPSADVIEIRGS